MSNNVVSDLMNTIDELNIKNNDLERQLEEAREAIKEHKRRKQSWGFEGADYDKDLWEQLKEQGE